MPVLENSMSMSKLWRGWPSSHRENFRSTKKQGISQDTVPVYALYLVSLPALCAHSDTLAMPNAPTLSSSLHYLKVLTYWL